MSFKLVATDLDGTLLHSEYDVSQYTVDVLRRVQERGVHVVPVTARAPRSVQPVAEEFSIRGYAICGSGSLLYDLDERELVEDHPLDASVAARLVAGLRASYPGVVFAAEQHLRWVREPAWGDPILPIDEITEEDAIEIVRSPVTKLIAKHPAIGRELLMQSAEELVGEDAHVGHSGAGVHIEVLARGASKTATLERLCARLGVSREEVIAFGDYTIDIPMLVWAGRGVAPANAHEEVIAAADEVCASNDEDGVARTLDALIEAGAIG